MNKVEAYIKKTGDNRGEVQSVIAGYVTSPGPDKFMVEGDDYFLFARVEGKFLIIDLAFGDWIEQIRPMAIDMAVANGCKAMRWTSSRSGMARRADILRAAGKCDVNLIAYVYEERM